MLFQKISKLCLMKVIVFQWGHFHLRTSMREREVAKEKEQKCEDAMAKRDDAIAKVRRCEGEGAILQSSYKM